MNIYRNNRNTERLKPAIRQALAKYDRATILRQWRDFQFRISDALTSVIVFGATGSGKTSGPGNYLALAYLAFGFGFLVLCSKPEERRQWAEWAAATGRTDDLIIVDKSGKWRYNFLAEAAKRAASSLDIVNLLEIIAQAISGTVASGENKFWNDSLRLLLTNAVDLCLFSGTPVTLPALRRLVISAPLSLEEMESTKWQEESECWKAMRKAAARKDELSADEREDLTECVTYFTREFPAMSSRSRSIFLTMFTQLTRPFTTRPLRRLFCEDTNISPTAIFDSKIIVIDIPIQEDALTGRVAAITWKTCFQGEVLRRPPAPPGQNLRPVCLWADECQGFLTHLDFLYQATCRSAGGCTVYLTQTREALRSVLGSNDMVDALLANLQSKWFCQNSGETNEYAARLLGERWTNISHSGYSFGGSGSGGGGHTETAEQRRYFCEPTTLSTLARGGKVNGYAVEAVVYNGGAQYDHTDPVTGQTEKVPYFLLTIPQENPQ